MVFVCSGTRLASFAINVWYVVMLKAICPWVKMNDRKKNIWCTAAVHARGNFLLRFKYLAVTSVIRDSPKKGSALLASPLLVFWTACVARNLHVESAGAQLGRSMGTGWTETMDLHDFASYESYLGRLLLQVVFGRPLRRVASLVILTSFDVFSRVFGDTRFGVDSIEGWDLVIHRGGLSRLGIVIHVSIVLGSNVGIHVLNGNTPNHFASRS